jgi:hypothetical protein
MTKSTPLPLDVSPEYYEKVGRIASDWATLEYVLNECIWSVAQIDEQLGACITAQITSLSNRLEALRLLLRARGASSKLISSLYKFSEKVRHPTELRNRAVHDPLGVHEDDGEARQLQITARGTLVFELRKIDLKAARRTRACRR